jgi:hypothetical protein
MPLSCVVVLVVVPVVVLKTPVWSGMATEVSDGVGVLDVVDVADFEATSTICIVLVTTTVSVTRCVGTGGVT